MIASQLATCEECRDGSCSKCRAWKRRQKRWLAKHEALHRQFQGTAKPSALLNPGGK